MKAQLTFNLPEDSVEFEEAVNGGKWKHVCWEMNQWLRKETKYATDDTSPDTIRAYENCREALIEIVNDMNLNFD